MQGSLDSRTHLSSYRCTVCGSTYPYDQLLFECNVCGSTLDVIYDYESIKNRISRRDLEDSASVWGFAELLPYWYDHVITLGEGNTYLHRASALSQIAGLDNLFIKADTQNPTATYIDRGSTVLITKLFHDGIESISTASHTGMEIGNSIAAYTSKAGISCKIFVPATRGPACYIYRAVALYGANISFVDGNIMSARRRAQEDEAFFVNSNNPFLLEGYKTISYEICTSLKWEVPGFIVVPVREGHLISMIWKGFKELYTIGFIDSLPKLVGVQADDTAPVIDGFRKGTAPPYVDEHEEEDAALLALYSPRPLDYVRAIKALKDSEGCGVTISTEEALKANYLLGSKEGILATPGACATLAAITRLREDNVIDAKDVVVCTIPASACYQLDLIEDFSAAKKGLRGLKKSGLATGLPMYKMGRTKYLVLKLIGEKPEYGYELWKKLVSETGRKVKVPIIYYHLDQLWKMGLVQPIDEEGESKRRYKLTEKGERLLNAIELTKTARVD